MHKKIILFILVASSLAPLTAGSVLNDIATGGVCLIGAAITGLRAQDSFARHQSPLARVDRGAHVLGRAVADLARGEAVTYRERVNRDVQEVQAELRALVREHGPTVGWAAASFFLGALGIRSVYKGITR